MYVFLFGLGLGILVGLFPILKLWLIVGAAVGFMLLVLVAMTFLASYGEDMFHDEHEGIWR